MVLHLFGSSGFPSGHGHLTLFGFGWLFVMLMLFDIGQYSGFLTELIKTAKGFFKRLIIADFNACQLYNTPFTIF